MFPSKSIHLFFRFLPILCLTCLPLAIAASAGERQPVGQLFYNEDCTNIFFYHDVADGRAGDLIDRYVDVVADAGVTVFLCNTNARRTNYRSRVWDAFWDGYDPAGPDDQPFLAPVPAESVAQYRRLIGNMRAADQQGVDYPARVIQRCRQRGVSPWITLRMNDCHENAIPDHPFHGRFWRDNPQFARQNCPGYFATCLDYAHPEVRDHYMAIIQETLDRYDIDGLELDFMREPYLFSAGGEAEGSEILTQWIRDVRARVDQAAARRGHPIRLGVRMPSRPETASAMGLDAVGWAREGLIDLLVATPRWATLQFDIPIQAWRQQLGDAKTTLAGGLEVRYQPCPGGPAGHVWPQLATGAAVSVLAQGADAVYLFNHFQDGSPGWTPEVYRNTLQKMRSLGFLCSSSRRVGVTYRDIVAPGEAYTPPLPATGTEMAFSLTLGPTSDGDWTCGVEIEAAAEEVVLSGIAVEVNGTACGLPKAEDGESQPGSMQFRVPPAALEGKETHAVKIISRSGKPVTVRRVEMFLDRPDRPTGAEKTD